MKKIINITLTLAAVFFHCSCVDEELVQNESASEIRVYSDFSQTRTSHQSENGVTSVSWVERDEIGLSTEEQMNLCYFAKNSGPSSDFAPNATSLNAKNGDIVYAYYPYDQENTSETASLHLPKTQKQYYHKGLADYDALYAKGTVENNELALRFNHIFAVLKITVPTDKLIKDSNNGRYALKLISDQMLSCINGNYNIETLEFDGDYTNDLIYLIKDDIDGTDYITITAAILPQVYGANISICAYDENNSIEYLLYNISVPECGLEAGKVYTLSISDEQMDIEKERSIEALTALYNSTNGDNWKNNTNWLSDAPLYEWYGLNANYWPESTIEVDDIVEIQLFDNNLRGTLPVEFAHIMSKANAIQIEGNGLYGVIPQEVREHPKWQKFGWNIIRQSPYFGGGFDFSEGTGLKLPEGEISFFVAEEVRNSRDVLAANELTFVVNVGLVDEDIQGISKERVDYYLDYKDKGLGMIVTVGEFWDYSFDEYKNYVLEQRENGLPEEIMWCKAFVSDLTGQSGMSSGEMQLFDKEGNLLAAWERDYAISEAWYLEQLDAIVRERLGEPEDEGDGLDYIDEYGVNHGPGVEIDGVVWAPVNCGYHETDFKYGKLYQWGRKYGQGYNGDLYDVNGNHSGTYSDAAVPEIVQGPVDLSVGESKDNADVFYCYNPLTSPDWCNIQDDYLWNAGTEDEPIKTEYDPCPRGWRVPTFSELSSLVVNHSSWTTDASGRIGYWFSGSSTYSSDVEQVFIPAAGSRMYSNGNVGNRGFGGYYWSSTPAKETRADALWIFSHQVDVSESTRFRGNSVRCVQGDGNDDGDSSDEPQFIYLMPGTGYLTLYIGDPGLAFDGAALTVTGVGNYLKLDVYSADGSTVVPGTYYPCAEAGTVTEGTFGIGWDPGDMWNIGWYFTNWGTCYMTRAEDGTETGVNIVDGIVTIEQDGDNYVITLESSAMNFRYEGPLA